MPYTPNSKNLPANVKKMGAKDKRQWCHVWNSAYKSCVAKGTDTKACETLAFTEANGVVAKGQGLLGALWFELQDLFGGTTVDQSVSMPDLYAAVNSGLHENPDSPWQWLVDVYAEPSNGSMFALVSQEGKLYKYPITFTGDDVQLGTAQEVVADFRPVAQSFLISRSTDGSTRWFLRAGTTVINRNGQIDSRQLFDNFILHAKETEHYPYLTFFHLGEVMRMGMTDYLARDEDVLIASGTFDKNDIADAMLRAYAADPAYWGSSVSFMPFAMERMAMVEVSRDITIPVYQDGELEEISILPEKWACAILTALRVDEINREVDMKPEIREALLKLFDAATVDKIAGDVDGTNETIKTQGLVTRDAAPATPAVEPTAPVAVVVETPVVEVPAVAQATEPPVIELDDAALDALTDKLLANPKFIAALGNASANIVQSIQTLSATVTKMDADLTKRVASLEKPEDEKKAEYIASLPRNQVTQRATYRPRAASKEEPATRVEAHSGLADIAAQTSSKLNTQPLSNRK